MSFPNCSLRTLSARWIPSILALILGIACRNDPVALSSPDVAIRVQAVSPTNAPVPYAAITVFGFYSSGRAALASGALTDSFGFLRILDTLPGRLGRLDSLEVGPTTAFVDCAHAVPFDTILHHSLGATLVTLQLVLATAHPSAALALGESCAAGSGDESLFPEVFWVHLQIDTIADSVRGYWQIDYRLSRRTEFGPFVGAVSGSQLELTLEPAPGFGGCIPRYRLVAQIENGDSLGLAQLTALADCAIYGTPFRLMEWNDPYFP
jgi:hypothetical protein